MKITFLNPPFLEKFSRPQRSPAVTKSGTLYYPMWLAYAAAVAEKEGHEIDFIDAPAAGLTLRETLDRIGGFKPALVVSDTSTPSVFNDISVCETIKKENPKTFILLVGTHVSALPEETISAGQTIDAIAVGEYDYTVRDLARAIEKGNDINGVAGLCVRGENSTVRTAMREPIEDLDEIPFVSAIYRRFLKIDDYFNANAIPPMVTIITSRGCPFHCTFCVYPQTLMGHKMRLRSVKNVVDEIEYIAKSFPEAKSIFFEDDTFTVNKKRCMEIAAEIKRRGITMSWTANARADLDYETMKAMKDAGLRLVCVGFESGSQQLLDNIKKKIHVDRLGKFMDDARRAGILVHGCFMVGLPGETRETMRMTLDLAKSLNPDTVQFYPIMVYPGTEAYEWYKERNLITTSDFSKWITPAGLHNTVVRAEDISPEEMVRFCDQARREFYLRPGYIFYKLKQAILNPAELKRNIRSAKTFLKYLARGSDVEKSGDRC